MSYPEPLMTLFADPALVTFVCFGCGISENKSCLNDKKFKTFVKTKVNTSNECNECKSVLNLFRDPYGRQYWINPNK